MGVPKSLPKPTREYPVITNEDLVAKRTFTFNQEMNRSDLFFGSAFTINDKLYDETDCDVAPKVGTCEEWRIANAHDEIHPFHLHENLFQVTAINDTPLNPVETWMRSWYRPKRATLTEALRCASGFMSGTEGPFGTVTVAPL